MIDWKKVNEYQYNLANLMKVKMKESIILFATKFKQKNAQNFFNNVEILSY